MAGDDVMGVLSTKVLFRGWTTFGVATIRERDGSSVDRAFEDHGAAAVVLPYDPERRVALLVRQRRIGPILCGLADDVLEAPAGGLGGEAPDIAARREALEETGVHLRDLEPISVILPMPSISTEQLHLFLAPYAAADRVADGGGLADEDEHIEVVEVALPALAALADTGRLPDAKTLILTMILRQRRPDLFEAATAV